MAKLSTSPVVYNTLLGQRIIKMSAANIECTPSDTKRSTPATGEREIIRQISYFSKEDQKFFKIWTMSGASYKVPLGVELETEKVSHRKPRRYDLADKMPGAKTFVHKANEGGYRKAGDRTTQGRTIYVRDLGDGVVIGCLTTLDRFESSHDGGYASNKVRFQLFSNCHWSSDPVYVDVDSDHFGEGLRVNYNYSGGGCEADATALQVAKANAGLHALAGEILALYPEAE